MYCTWCICMWWSFRCINQCTGIYGIATYFNKICSMYFCTNFINSNYIVIYFKRPVFTVVKKKKCNNNKILLNILIIMSGLRRMHRKNSVILVKYNILVYYFFLSKTLKKNIEEISLTIILFLLT